MASGAAIGIAIAAIVVVLIGGAVGVVMYTQYYRKHHKKNTKKAVTAATSGESGEASKKAAGAASTSAPSSPTAPASGANPPVTEPPAPAPAPAPAPGTVPPKTGNKGSGDPKHPNTPAPKVMSAPKTAPAKKHAGNSSRIAGEPTDSTGRLIINQWTGNQNVTQMPIGGFTARTDPLPTVPRSPGSQVYPTLDPHVEAGSIRLRSGAIPISAGPENSIYKPWIYAVIKPVYSHLSIYFSGEIIIYTYDNGDINSPEAVPTIGMRVLQGGVAKPPFGSFALRPSVCKEIPLTAGTFDVNRSPGPKVFNVGTLLTLMPPKNTAGGAVESDPVALTGDILQVYLNTGGQSLIGCFRNFTVSIGEGGGPDAPWYTSPPGTAARKKEDGSAPAAGASAGTGTGDGA